MDIMGGQRRHRESETTVAIQEFICIDSRLHGNDG